jgi:hypothetical protein
MGHVGDPTHLPEDGKTDGTKNGCFSSTEQVTREPKTTTKQKTSTSEGAF